MSGEPRRIEYASQSRFRAVEHLAPRFFHEVLQYEYADCLVTDESRLSDFADLCGDREAQVATMLDRIEAHYLIDGRAVGSTRVVDLLEFLKSRGVVG